MSSANTPSPQIRWWHSSERKRLLSAVTVMEEDLRAMFKPGGVQSDEIRQACDKLLKRAKEACKKSGETDLGWNCVHTAYRLAVTELSDQEIKAIALAVREEALDKLGSWRKQSVEHLLPEADDFFPKTEKSGRAEPETLKRNLFHSLFLIHEHYRNTYYKLATVQTQMFILFVIAALASLAWIAFAPEIRISAPNASQVTSPPLDLWNWKWRAIAALFGVMGATLSGILSVARNSIQGRIPDMLLNWRLTMAKLFVGAISALALQTALVSGTLKIQDAAATPGSVMLVAFAAGFTERLVERAIETVAPSSKP